MNYFSTKLLDCFTNARKAAMLLALSIYSILSPGYAQTLVVGTTTDNPPFASLADSKNNFYGFEIDIMVDICRRLAEKCVFKPVQTRAILSQLAEKKIDFAIAAIIIVPNKPAGFIFSAPYLASGAQFIAQSKSTIQNPTDIVGKRVGVRIGTLYGGTYFKQFALQLYNNQINVKEYPSINDLMLALGEADVDVNLINAPAAGYWYANNKNTYKLIGNSLPVGDGYAIMSIDAQADMMNRINQALQQMMDDGTYKKIYSAYF